MSITSVKAVIFLIHLCFICQYFYIRPLENCFQWWKIFVAHDEDVAGIVVFETVRAVDVQKINENRTTKSFRSVATTPLTVFHVDQFTQTYFKILSS